MRQAEYVRIFSDPDGESHFEDEDGGRGGRIPLEDALVTARGAEWIAPPVNERILLVK